MAARLRTIVLCSAGHMGSATVLNRLVESDEFEVVGIVKAQTVPMSRKGVRKLKRHLKQTGWRFGWLLFWQQIIQGLAYFLGRLLPGRKHVRPSWKIAEDLGVPILECENINNPAACDWLRSLDPDIFVSAYFSQILKPQVIRIPRRGVLNIHPGWLPAYRGAMAYFWVLRNGEQSGGVTVHWIDEGIDTGPILARRQFRLTPGMTQQHVLVLTAVIGSRLLIRVARKLQQKEALNPVSQEALSNAAYFPMPQEGDFDAYIARRRFFRARDIFGYLTKVTRRRCRQAAPI